MFFFCPWLSLWCLLLLSNASHISAWQSFGSLTLAGYHMNIMVLMLFYHGFLVSSVHIVQIHFCIYMNQLRTLFFLASVSTNTHQFLFLTLKLRYALVNNIWFLSFSSYSSKYCAIWETWHVCIPLLGSSIIVWQMLVLLFFHHLLNINVTLRTFCLTYDLSSYLWCLWISWECIRPLCWI